MSKHNDLFKLLRKVPGIYCIKNIINNKQYIGSSANIGNRFGRHVTCLRGKYHTNTHLQHSWNKYGESNFTFHIVEITPISNLIVKEQFWIDKLNVVNDIYGYNIKPFADKSGMSEKTKAKISKTKKGVPMKEETKRKLSIAKTGIKTNLSVEGRQKIVENGKLRKGWKHSEETKNKISKAKKGTIARKGFKLPEYQKQILREYRLKNPSPRDPITGRFLSK